MPVATSTKNIHYFFSGELADHLANTYGDRLEDMPLEWKLVLQSAINLTLLEAQTNPVEEPSVFDPLGTLCELQNPVHDSELLTTTFEFVDAATLQHCAALAMVLGMYISEEFR